MELEVVLDGKDLGFAIFELDVAVEELEINEVGEVISFDVEDLLFEALGELFFEERELFKGLVAH